MYTNVLACLAVVPRAHIHSTRHRSVMSGPLITFPCQDANVTSWLCFVATPGNPCRVCFSVQYASICCTLFGLKLISHPCLAKVSRTFLAMPELGIVQHRHWSNNLADDCRFILTSWIHQRLRPSCELWSCSTTWVHLMMKAT